jgi:hypothetical protein
MLRRMGSGFIAPPLLTSVLVGGDSSASRPGHFTLKERVPRYPLDKRLGGIHIPFGPCGVEKNLLPLQGIEPRPLARHYVDWAMSAVEWRGGWLVDIWQTMSSNSFIRRDKSGTIPGRPRVDSRSGDVGFLVEKVTLRYFLRLLQFPPAILIPATVPHSLIILLSTLCILNNDTVLT